MKYVSVLADRITTFSTYGALIGSTMNALCSSRHPRLTLEADLQNRAATVKRLGHTTCRNAGCIVTCTERACISEHNPGELEYMVVACSFAAA